VGSRPPSTLSQLGVQLRLGVWMAREQVPGPAQRIRRRLVSGEKDRQALIEQKLVRHVACSHLVVRAHQQRQHVVVTRRFAAMLFDDLQQHRLDAVASLACASLVEPPQGADHLHERIVDSHKEPECLGKACADATRFLRHIGAEERKADDAQRETHHLFTADDTV
jgi:hypothetical protein